MSSTAAATLFCMGAFRDAFWLRRNNPNSATHQNHLESPLSCLALLATLAAVSILIAMTVRVPDLPSEPFSHLRGSRLGGGMQRDALVFLPASARPHCGNGGPLPIVPPMPWPTKLRRGIFLALKIALLQPIMLSGFLIELMLGRLGGLAGLGFDAAVILVLRWVIMDQQRRCPVCLRLLTTPVRIGTPSRTFLEWYGAESTCSRGHGLLHISEMSSGYSGKAAMAAPGRFLERSVRQRRRAANMTLELRSVSKRFSGIPAVDDVSFRRAPVKSPDTWGRTGPANRPP